MIDDPNLQLQTAFHDTSSAVFLSPRKDKKILVPAISFDKEPALNLWVMVSDTLPKTHELTNRKWATWCGRNILQSIPTELLSFTPETGAMALSQSKEALEIYRDILKGKEQNRNRLKSILQNLGLAGGWFKYYTDELPRMALDDPNKAAPLVDNTFNGLEEKIGKASSQFHSLSPEDQQILKKPFRVTIRARFQQPYAYFSEVINRIRKNEPISEVDNMFVRDSLEIVGRTQGVDIDEIESIFLPDNAPREEKEIVKRRILGMGLGDRMKSESQIDGVEKYATCDLRYGKFTSDLLAQYIEEGRFKPLVPVEWKDEKYIKVSKAIAEQSQNCARKK